jgi:metal-sulfur cluster biosynthetic enzyme
VEPVVIAKQKILDSLQTVLDPELQVSILDLGLIYRVDVEKDKIEIDYTVTNPGCPAGPLIEEQIREALREITDIGDIRITLVWEPQWKPELMSEDLRVSMGYPI